ncbi:inositol monophosphatase family protein [Chitinilyticum litopenaei]|uniref:inositol monophosphatase family protein n=1 Tax=Chitinilyticum litopenaei TaxID=1121276 RepID=UPI0004246B3D|nr:inositol monophosphatase [Chitinilyticum litopenaei]
MDVLAQLQRLRDIARQVGAEVVMPRYQKVVAEKKHDGSLFTEADLAAQQALQRLLPELVPCPVLGEEMTQAEQEALWREHPQGLWVVDPIDGTTNFAHGLPYFAISIALMRAGRPQLAVVYLPVLDECFSAAAGQGAWLNDRRLPLVHDDKLLADAVATVETKWLSGHLAARVVTLGPFHNHRNFGASTIDWCWLAAGRTDVMLHGAQKLWDYAAGVLILQEAGGVVGAIHQPDFWQDKVWQRSVVAARTPALYEAWRGWVRANR